MRKTLMIALSAATLVAGIPAAQARPYHADPAAQSHAYRGDSWQMTPERGAAIRRDVTQLDRQIDRAAARRTISRREEAGLRRQANEVQRLYASYARNGLTRSEVVALEQRVNSVRAALRMERADWDGHRG